MAGHKIAVRMKSIMKQPIILICTLLIWMGKQIFFPQLSSRMSDPLCSCKCSNDPQQVKLVAAQKLAVRMKSMTKRPIILIQAEEKNAADIFKRIML